MKGRSFQPERNLQGDTPKLILPAREPVGARERRFSGIRQRVFVRSILLFLGLDKVGKDEGWVALVAKVDLDGRLSGGHFRRSERFRTDEVRTEQQSRLKLVEQKWTTRPPPARGAAVASSSNPSPDAVQQVTPLTLAATTHIAAHEMLTTTITTLAEIRRARLSYGFGHMNYETI